MSAKDVAKRAFDGAKTAVPLVIGVVGGFDRLRQWWLSRDIVQRRRAGEGLLGRWRARRRERRTRNSE